MIKVECKIVKRDDDNVATAIGSTKVTGDCETVVNELRVVFKQLEKAVGEAQFAEALNDWLIIEKGFKG